MKETMKSSPSTLATCSVANYLTRCGIGLHPYAD